MKVSDLISLRLVNQQFSAPSFQTARDLVGWMGAIQAQDYQQAKWAIGVRVPHLTEQQVESAFSKGEIIRTHLMRPTWHFVASDHIYWMLKLTAPQIKKALNSRHRELELTETAVKRSQEIMVQALGNQSSMTREEMLVELGKSGLPTDLQRASHFMLRAEIDGVICSGPIKGKKQTYSLLSERVPVKITLTREEALARLAKSYFSSHGPATLADFVWWSGLPVADARRGLKINKTDFNSALIDSDTYWFSDPGSLSRTLPDSLFLLPAYDEFLISYKNRSAVITADDHKKAISDNGVFKPVVLVNGQISGLWKRTLKKDKIIIETDHFRVHDKAEEHLMVKAVDWLGRYSEKKAEIKMHKMIT